jgi:aryl-alcohol dehydrogenase-like predicted oxidoreductase
MEAFTPWNGQERTWAILDEVRRIADAHGSTSARVSLAWLEAQPAVTSVILGARTVEQLEDNMASADLVLTADEIASLSAVSAPVVSDYPYGPAGVQQRHRAISERG